MRFSIVTPSYKQPAWLRLCAASVADQSAPGLEIEHIVQDSMSGPEIAEAVSAFPQVKLISEKDEGMYDAINRGWRKSTGDILCWLNCDEQYLPGALQEVADYFSRHPEVDVLFADTIVVDDDGDYMCSRQVLYPQLYHTWTCHLQTFSCATFFRSHLLKERGFMLDPRWKDLGDADLIIRLLRANVTMAVMRRYLSTFVDNGDNRNLKPLARQERKILTAEAPFWVRSLRLIWMLQHRLQRLGSGLYQPQPFAYDIYTKASSRQRVHFDASRPTFFWKARMRLEFSLGRREKKTADSPAQIPSQSPVSPVQRHLFVIGFFRSGTSLLYSFLNLHPQIKLLFEANPMSNVMVPASFWSGGKWWERLDFFNSCIRRHKIHIDPPIWNQARSRAEAAGILYREYGGSQSLYIGEKSPSYYNCLPALARQFPEARFIVIWRNPEDVISSILHAGRTHYFFRNHSLLLRSLIGFGKLQRDVLSCRARGTAILDFCYEDMISDPEATMKSICKFLELPFDPQMLDLEKADCTMFPPGEHHSRAKSGELKNISRPNSPALDQIRPKVWRYLTHWKAQFADQLSTRRYWSKANDLSPDPLEIFCDRFYYQCKRLYWEQLTPFIYGILPFLWLRTYRRWRGHVSAPTSSSDYGMHPGTPRPRLKISVITPSYKQLPWLKLCIASVADQQGVSVEHIIQDAQSGPDLENWVRENSKAHLHVESDSGIYDAINRGFSRATGDIVCWLNSDEELLEGALTKVADYFQTYPDLEVVFGDALLIGNTGTLLSYQKITIPSLNNLHLSEVNIPSCTPFVRRSVLERGYRLDTRWRAIADSVWIVEMLKAGVRMATLNEPLAVTTLADHDKGKDSLAAREAELWQQQTASEKTWLQPLSVWRSRLNKLSRGVYRRRKVSARFYTLASPQQRIDHEASLPGFIIS